MKVELPIPQEFVTAIAKEVVSLLKPVLSRMEAPQPVDGLMGVAELGKYLGGVSKDWIYQRTAKNEIPFYKICHRIMFRRSEIDRWLSTHSSAAVAPLSGTLPTLRPVSGGNPSQDMQSHGRGSKK